MKGTKAAKDDLVAALRAFLPGTALQKSRHASSQTVCYAGRPCRRPHEDSIIEYFLYMRSKSTVGFLRHYQITISKKSAPGSV
ncbi:unnamed protein product [Amoebophrya sp. A120]|nr:unnamed protein product [Amoebophrya sp. A120]|eukprot:GSA120T00023131001.1